MKDEQKQNGVVIADIGGGTTDGIIFQNGKPIDVFTVNIGGSLMTQDIAKGLNVNQELAETVKKEFGLRYIANSTQLYDDNPRNKASK